ncbi:AMP-binding protein [Steroidobacter denitrificans]|uniref:AMP-binding protein n=1 Tax=Steroidobacter denitrificans TaxID=465721 RepID=UPI000A89B59E|nr:AMP-binding protein [Steroidobacter denitrificans]
MNAAQEAQHGVDKIWLKNYPAGVPEQINPDEYSSLVHLLEESCARYADLPAYTSMGRTLTYRRYEQLSRDFAAWLQQEAKLGKGERIALMMPNVLQYPIALFGALRAGLVVINTNPLYTARELEHQLNDSGVKAVVILENFAHTLSEVIARTRVEQVIISGAGDQLRWPKSSLVNLVVRHIRKQIRPWKLPGAVRFNAALDRGGFLTFMPVAVGHDDIAFLQYTGGTTGVAKGAMLTHRNMVANLLQSAAWIGIQARAGKDTIITALPLYHIFALTANWLVFTHYGAHNILIANARDFPAFVKELKAHPFTYISGVNTLFNALLHTPGFESVDFSALRITLGGGMAVQRSVAERWKRVTGNTLTQAWGLTETSPAACINPFTIEYNGSIGLPISSTEISIRDDAGQALDIGEVGEICVRGPQVMRGYWNRPEETAQVMIGDWLRTGDIGRMDQQGYVYIEDRKKDMILVSGFNVYPNEIESVAATHPGVLEVAAVAQPDRHSGEVVALFVVRQDPNLTEQQLIDHCRKELTNYKVPKHVYFRDELPKTNVGKIRRKALRDELPA